MKRVLSLITTVFFTQSAGAVSSLSIPTATLLNLSPKTRIGPTLPINHPRHPIGEPIAKAVIG
ncbi:hypothetical protein ROA7450_00197 [Roseovarius albus]|uniref:Uncharacterized protein n=1 Tax=Roseovarius albus TaxID=1247867 RepID=A0A1X6Y7V3_9RHOB|nr:hypothetical protein ROA7450_00197 [Roseovarius albus]